VYQGTLAKGGQYRNAARTARFASAGRPHARQQPRDITSAAPVTSSRCWPWSAPMAIRSARRDQLLARKHFIADPVISLSLIPPATPTGRMGKALSRS